MAEATLLREVVGSTVILSINRPSVRNALDLETLEALISAIGEADADRDLRAVVLRGAKGGPFSAGYDLGSIGDAELNVAEVKALHAPIRRLAAAMSYCRHPVIAAIRGFAIGAALDVAAHADLRVAEAGTRFALPAARLGFTYPLEGIRRLCWTFGPSATEALLMEGRSFRAGEAAAHGFCHQVWPEEAFEASLAAWLEEIGGRAPLAVRGMKRALRQLADGAGPAAEDEIYEIMTACMNSSDAREGPRAFREKREPCFTGS